MAAGYQAGSGVVIKLGDGGGPEAFTTVGSTRSDSLTINRENIDVTNKSSNFWQEMIAGGVRGIEMTSGFVYKSDETIQNDLIDLAMADDNKANFQLVIPGGTGETITFEGSFFIESFAPVESAEYNGEVSGSFTLKSNGAITLTRA